MRLFRQMCVHLWCRWPVGEIHSGASGSVGARRDRAHGLRWSTNNCHRIPRFRDGPGQSGDQSSQMRQRTQLGRWGQHYQQLDVPVHRRYWRSRPTRGTRCYSQVSARRYHGPHGHWWQHQHCPLDCHQVRNRSARRRLFDSRRQRI